MRKGIMKMLLSVSFFLAYSNTQAQEGTYLSIPEEQPEFPGRMVVCMKFISSNINYSLFDSIPDNIEGRSTVAFRLDTLGNMFTIETIKEIHPILNKEALRIVNLMPKWKPYRIKGIAKECPFAVSVIFRRKDILQKVVNDGWVEFAEFPYGSSELTEYIRKSIISNYKELLWHMPVDSVWVKTGIYQFIVTEEGKIRQLQTIRESNRTLERMALYVLSQMPEWNLQRNGLEMLYAAFYTVFGAFLPIPLAILLGIDTETG